MFPQCKLRLGGERREETVFLHCLSSSGFIMFLTNCLDSVPVCDSPGTYTEEK